MKDPINTRTEGKFNISDAVTLGVGVIVLLGSLALDAYGIWTLPRELKMAVIGGAMLVVFGEKAYKAVVNT